MTENEEKFEELIDAVCRLVCIAEDAICREGFEELDNAGAEIIACLEEIQQYRAIGTVEEFKDLKEKNQEVVIGEWIDTQPQYNNGYYKNAHMCSNCNDYYTTEYDEMKFCPNCGAKMDRT